MGPIEELDDAKAIVHVLEQDAIDLMADSGRAERRIRYGDAVFHGWVDSGEQDWAQSIACQTQFIAACSRVLPKGAGKRKRPEGLLLPAQFVSA